MNDSSRSQTGETDSRGADARSDVRLSPAVDRPLTQARVIKHADTFAVFDQHGDAVGSPHTANGLYHRGTRFLNELRCELGGARPLLLGSAVSEQNELLFVDLTNPPIVSLRDGDRHELEGESLHIQRSLLVFDAELHARLRITNHGAGHARTYLDVLIGNDFADVFEVRGAVRKGRGRLTDRECGRNTILWRYVGLDGLVRSTNIGLEPTPDELSPVRARYRLSLPPGASWSLCVHVACEIGDAAPSRWTFSAALRALRAELERHRRRRCVVRTSNELFNGWLERSFADIASMLTELPHGPYPYAGIPWYNTLFGRDGIITALETLWVDPAIALGVLRNLAALQSDRFDPTRDAEPGKIIHELRDGEMAALDEVPFGRYYGTVDATPLFVLLAHRYYVRTGDAASLTELWPAVVGALDWIEKIGDRDGDLFLEYERECPGGLTQQGWKDSDGSVFHADGSDAPGPIALCEVQGYAFAAMEGAAELARLTGDDTRAARLLGAASALRERFRERFWSERLGVYVPALDGSKRRCEIRASNAGHALYTGIAAPEHAGRVVEALMGDGLFSGWGLRTLDAREARYNPMSYHNGSVWPHDSAVAAAGMARYGYKSEAVRLFSALFDVSVHVDLHRIPELFCGFERLRGRGPTWYPVACAPQAWAAGALFLFLEACTGLSIDARARQITFDRPLLPRWLDWVVLEDLRVGESRVDLRLRRAGRDVALEVGDRRGGSRIVVAKTV